MTKRYNIIWTLIAIISLILALALDLTSFGQYTNIDWKNIDILKVYEDDSHTYFYESLYRNNQAYLGDRQFKKGGFIYKVKTKKLNNEFGFYDNIDGYELRKSFLKFNNLTDE